jgi:HAMP domain-containing protein
MVLMLGRYLSRTISRPLLKLVNATIEVAKGNFDKTIDFKSNDEIGYLSMAFNTMTTNLKKTTTTIDSLEREIYERKKVEISLKDSEEKFRMLYESSADAIMMLKPPLWLFYACNSATLVMFGTRDETEFLSKTPDALSPEYQPDGRYSSEKALEMINTALKNGSHFFEWTHKRINGKEFFATVLLTKVSLCDKEFLQATGISRSLCSKKKGLKNKMRY